MSGRGYPSSDRQVSDLRPPTTANVSAPDPTAGEGCTVAEQIGNRMDLAVHEAFCYTCRPATPDVSDATSESLTEDEEALLLEGICYGHNNPDMFHGNCEKGVQRVAPAVERIVAAREAAAATKARADERERIAQAIEAKYLGPDSGRSHDGREAPDAHCRNAYDEGLETAARIARDGGR